MELEEIYITYPCLQEMDSEAVNELGIEVDGKDTHLYDACQEVLKQRGAQ